MDQHILPPTQIVRQSQTYLEMIRGSIGSHLFRRLYVEKGGKPVDILDDGRLSCAFFVSSILKHFDLVETPHATVAGLVRDMSASGWHNDWNPLYGTVLVWEPISQAGGESHAHVGFWLDELRAISHSDTARVPIIHSTSMGFPARRITAIYRHPFLERE